MLGNSANDGTAADVVQSLRKCYSSNIGFEFIHRHGFTMQVAAGYSWLLNKNNFTFVEGHRDDHLASALFGSGPVLSTAFGYAFD